MLSLALGIASLLSPQTQDSSPSTPWQVTQLDNGVVLHVMQEKDAPKQTTFTLLPIGLSGDPAGRAQFAHLAEHMMIRSTDPESLQVGGIAINGETTALVMRLETLASVESWREALARHARWLTARSFAAESLAKEKLRIAGEEGGTVPKGFNHKWAQAAWSQIMAGREHAAVHGDVAAATLEHIEAYVRQRVELASVRMFAIGPRSMPEQVELLEKEFTDIQATRAPEAVEANTSAKVAAESPAAAEAGHRELTWDLDARHYLEWYLLPEGTSRLATQLISQSLSTVCSMNPTLRSIPGSGLTFPAFHGGRSYIVFSANAPGDMAVEELREAVAAVLKNGEAMLRWQSPAAAAKKALARPDFAAQRKLQRVARLRDLVEAQHAMMSGYACLRAGLAVTELAQAYDELGAMQLVEILTQTRDAEERSSALITNK